MRGRQRRRPGKAVLGPQHNLYRCWMEAAKESRTAHPHCGHACSVRCELIQASAALARRRRLRRSQLTELCSIAIVPWMLTFKNRAGKSPPTYLGCKNKSFIVAVRAKPADTWSVTFDSSLHRRCVPTGTPFWLAWRRLSGCRCPTSSFLAGGLQDAQLVVPRNMSSLCWAGRGSVR